MRTGNLSLRGISPLRGLFPLSPRAKQNKEELRSFLSAVTSLQKQAFDGCAVYQKRRTQCGVFLLCIARRVRDSNPRSLSAQQFSRLPPSTTRPTLHPRRDCKDRYFRKYCKNYFILVFEQHRGELLEAAAPVEPLVAGAHRLVEYVLYTVGFQYVAEIGDRSVHLR